MRWIGDACQDLRIAARLVIRKPGFAAVAVATLALGIGGATAVFSIVNAVLLRPLPYADPGRLVAIWDHGVHDSGVEKIFVSYRDFSQWSRTAHSFEKIGAATWAAGSQRVWNRHGERRQTLAVPVSASFFDTLGVRAEMGRTFRPQDETGGCAVVLSHAFWRTSLGADRAVVGRSLTLDQRQCTVLGVMPAGFVFYPTQAPMWILMGPDFEPQRDSMVVGVFARLRVGVTAAQAQAEVVAAHRALHSGDAWREFEPRVYGLHDEFTFLASRTLRTTVVLVFTAVLLLLGIACLNIANLLLARVTERQRELAVCAALGAGQGRLVRQVLAEGFAISLGGAALGVALAWGLARYFRSATPIEMPPGANVTIDVPVLLFAIILSIATTLVFSLVPALRASRIEIGERLKVAGRGSVQGGRSGLAWVLIAGETGMAFVLLTGAVLLMTSALHFGSADLGFEPQGLVSAILPLRGAAYADAAQRVAFCDRLLDRLSHMPGVAEAALGSKAPPQAGGNQQLEIQGQPSSDQARHDVGADAVSPSYFKTLGIPLRYGREIEARDGAESQPVAVVNEALVREYFPGSDPIGQQVRIADLGQQNMPWLTIVGVVGDVRHAELMKEMAWVESPILYRPMAQEARPSVVAIVRAAGDGGAVGARLQQEIRGLDPSIPVNDTGFAAVALGKTLAYSRFRASLVGLFAILALIISAVGVHGVLSQLVAQRTAEFGLRRAVGASAASLVRLVCRQGGMPVLAGLAAGVVCTLELGRLMEGFLYGVRPMDPAALCEVSAALLVVAALAMVLPAHRAAVVDPMVALREQ